jgi:hypothetical protein
VLPGAVGIFFATCALHPRFFSWYHILLRHSIQSPEDIAAVKKALAALPSASLRQLMLRMGKLGKSAAALIAALV